MLLFVHEPLDSRGADVDVIHLHAFAAALDALDGECTRAVRIGIDYPAPIVDTKAALAHARAQIKLYRTLPAMRKTSAAVYRKHGRRKPAPHDADLRSFEYRRFRQR